MSAIRTGPHLKDISDHAVDYDSLGASRAKAVSALLQELNDTVDAQFVEESPEALLKSNPRFFGDFTLVIATQVIVLALGY